ncbi:hypothetical protein EVAR_60677_1 [Eumeta japonica]|uniref:Uncharacterized protein n=1 Tax=Eumeta variegata TaxID=151549 RepID=A0A4C1ZX78_EUMVA|nr:hypothetical protein EVAR_60677_1 [Eumeta japonica]
MRGEKSGVQKRIIEINPLAYFLPCGSHSWNLIQSEDDVKKRHFDYEGEDETHELNAEEIFKINYFYVIVDNVRASGHPRPARPCGGSVGLKPTEKVPLRKLQTGSAVSWTSMTASPKAAGQHAGVPLARDMPYGRFHKKLHWHRMPLHTDTGRVH